MAKISVAEAIRFTGKSRATLYRAMHAGTLSRDPDGLIDTAELLRAGFTLREPPALDASLMPADIAPDPIVLLEHHVAAPETRPVAFSRSRGLRDEQRAWRNPDE